MESRDYPDAVRSAIMPGDATVRPPWEATMSMATQFLRRDPAEVEPWAETCGRIRPLIEEADGAAAEVHHVEIQDARLHYHERTDEFYYVIDGSGTMVLDDEEIELHPGVVVYVPRGVRHKAVGRLTVLTVCIPRGVLHDIHEVE
jgi:mannose-6-phosphate isomerase-like protein (cupin superfamily)